VPSSGRKEKKVIHSINKDFYPTPRSLAKKMLAKVKGYPKRITGDLSSLADAEIPVEELPPEEIVQLKVTVMKPETFAHWYISKAMDARADTKEIEFRIFDSEGEYVETLSNTEYRKRKRQILAAGYTVDSTKKTISFSEYDSRRGPDSRDRYEPADPDSLDLLVG
jgi:hypothetical protein